MSRELDDIVDRAGSDRDRNRVVQPERSLELCDERVLGVELRIGEDKRRLIRQAIFSQHVEHGLARERERGPVRDHHRGLSGEGAAKNFGHLPEIILPEFQHPRFAGRGEGALDGGGLQSGIAVGRIMKR